MRNDNIKVLPKYGEVALRREAQQYFTRFADWEQDEDPAVRNEAALMHLMVFNNVFLEESFADEDVRRILSEERANPTTVFTVVADKPFAVTAIPETKVVSVSPKITDKAFYGIAGRIINKLRPNTEAHPMGLLLEFLAAFGNMIGSTAYYQVEDSKHYCNINVVTVGKSSKARKGTGADRINRITSDLDRKWFSTRQASGLGSGEIVIHLVRDDSTKLEYNKKTKEWEEILVPGVDDKRLFVSEGEFAGILAVGNRKDNVLSKVIRDAWDHKPIRNLAKGGSSVCMNPHISISANITREELLMQMREADKFNGFGNRFLWCYVERQQLLPHGGEDIDWSEEIQELFKRVTFANKQQRVFMDRNAREMWKRIYEDLSEDAGGLVGAVTSRGEAQVIRLALIFSVLDCSEYITVDHLKAAQAVWNYCAESATFIFGGVTKDQYTLIEFLRNGSKPVTRIREDLYKRHRSVSEIKADLQRLIEIGRVVELTDEKGRPVYSPVGG
jgi:hypothetical protein